LIVAEILLAHNQRSLAAQAMHELGNVQYHNSNLRQAYKWWCDAVDLILHMQDAVTGWRTSFQGVRCFNFSQCIKIYQKNLYVVEKYGVN